MPEEARERYVTTPDSRSPMQVCADILLQARQKGVRFWLDRNELHYSGPSGALSHEEIEKLRTSRTDIIALLQAANEVQPGVAHPSPECVPLSFTQFAHWSLYGLRSRRAKRDTASATRLRGPVSIEVLRQALAAVVHRHDALRTRIVVVDMVPMQKITESNSCDMDVFHLPCTAGRSRDLEIRRLFDELILTSIDIANDPLFAVRLLRLGDDEHVLIVATQHMISDAVSLKIFLRDLFLAYGDLFSGRSLSWSEKPRSFADHALLQRRSVQTWIAAHGAYWDERLAGCGRLRFPVDDAPFHARTGWNSIRVRIGRDVTAALRSWCRQRRTTLVMSVFAAYVATVLRWCNAPQLVIQYQWDGRVGPGDENIIGYFASTLYLCLELEHDDSLIDVLHQVTQEYCKAYEHADFGYVEARLPRPEFARNTRFNWIPRGSAGDPVPLGNSARELAFSVVEFESPTLRHLEMDNEPTIVLCDTEDDVIGDVYFPRDRFSPATMERFGRNFEMFTAALLDRTARRVGDIPLG